MADELVSIRIRLAGGTEAAGELKLVSTEVKAVGTASVEAAAETKASTTAMGRTAGRLRSAWTGVKRLAKFAAIGLAGAAVAVVAFGKKAVANTAELGKSTAGLTRTFGLGTEKASELLSLGKVRGSDATKTTMAFKTLATQTASAAKGSETAIGVFRKLGIGQKEIQKGLTKPGVLLDEISEGFGKLPGGFNKAAIGSKLFGKAMGPIFPLFRDGKKQLHEYLNEAHSYGAFLTGKGKDAQMEFVEQQRKMELAMIGLQITFTEKIVPTLTKVMNKFAEMMNEFRKGKGPIWDIIHALQPLGETLLRIGEFFIKNKLALKALVVTLTAFYIITKLVAVSQAILTAATAAYDVVLAASEVVMWAVDGAFLALDAAFIANPIGLVVLAIVALVAAFVVLYLKVKWFHNAVDAVVKFLRKFWPIAAGVLMVMFGPLVAIIILFPKLKNAAVNAFHWVKKAAIDAAQWVGNAFNNAKSAVENTVQWIKNAWNNAVNFFKKLPGRIGAAMADLGKKLAHPFVWAWEKISGILDKLKNAVSHIGGHVGPDIPLVPEIHAGPFSFGQFGVRNWQGGPIIVGEAGPEMVNLPRGADVLTHRETKHTLLERPMRSGVKTEVRQPIQLRLHGKAIAETVVTVQSDAGARQ